MDKEVILTEIEELIIEGKEVLKTKWSSSDYGVISARTYVNADVYQSWRSKSIAFLLFFLRETNEYVNTIKSLGKNSYSNASILVKTLENIENHINKGFIVLENKKESNVDEILERIFIRFHKVARQLRSRYSNRNTIEIEDEYDVQDLLYSLLHLYFDDIRAEEWTPSYAGSSARVDFLLKNEKVIIEVKKTRKGLTDKEVGNQLIEDIDRYKVHPDCGKLICFVYDPEGRIGNPNGLTNDLNSQHSGFVQVIIQPNM